MKHVKPMAGIMAAVVVLTRVAAGAEDLEATVAHLLDRVKTSDAVFIRNGKEHSARDAAAHMRKKYEHFKKDIKTPKDFIRLAATRSLLSREAYMVRTGDGRLLPCAQWMKGLLKTCRPRTGPPMPAKTPR
jgi:hypothetical protein